MSLGIKSFAACVHHEMETYGVSLTDGQIARLSDYYALIEKWNTRAHLFAPASPSEFARRHVLESCAAWRFVNQGEVLIDVGTGGGAPAIPLLVMSDDMRGVMVERAKLKAYFLREAVRVTQLQTRVEVINNSFQQVGLRRMTAGSHAVITCRAIERFAQILPQLIAEVSTGSRLILFGGTDLQAAINVLVASRAVSYQTEMLLPQSERRFVFVLKKNEFANGFEQAANS